MFTLEINCGRFADGEACQELSHILRELAVTVERGEFQEGIIPDTFSLVVRDSHGWEVGHAKYEPDFGEGDNWDEDGAT